jgi:hypothetical protein
VQADPFSGGRQDVPNRASRTRSSQSGIDCGYRVVVPFGLASHADRVRADGQAAAVIRRGMIQGTGRTPSGEQMKARAAAIDQLLDRDDHDM